jgi:putative tricarboxylic transport membrane protein
MPGKDLGSAVFWLAVAAVVIAQGVALKLGTLGRPGPGFFPFWGGVILALLALILLVGARGQRATLTVTGLRWVKLLTVVAALLGYLLLLERLGFATVTALFLLLLFRLEGKGWGWSAAVSVAGAVSCYALFHLWLRTQLPVGPFGF